MFFSYGTHLITAQKRDCEATSIGNEGKSADVTEDLSLGLGAALSCKQLHVIQLRAMRRDQASLPAAHLPGPLQGEIPSEW